MYLPSVIIFFGVLLSLLVILYCTVLRQKNNILRKKLNDALHKKSEIGNFLSLFSQNLKSMEEIDNSMNMTASYVADLVEAKSTCIFRIDGDYIKAEGISGAFPNFSQTSDYILTKPRYILETLKRQKIKIGEGIIGEVVKTRDPLFLEDATHHPKIMELNTNVPIECIMAVPMTHQGKVIGAICSVNNRLDKPFTTEQFNRLKFITDQVVLAHNFVSVYANLSEQQRINQELQFARQLQSSLLPKHFPVWDQFVVHSFTRSAKEVNGDFYDFVEIDEDRLLLVVGDACGKGIPACMIMAMTRSFIRANITRFSNLKELLIELNDNLFRDTEEERFITLAVCLLDKQLSTIEYARAGHTPLVIYSNNKIRTIFPDGSALGLLPRELAYFDTLSFEFNHDTTILLFTDGITEALNDQLEEFGLNNLSTTYQAACEHNDAPDEITEKILEAIDNFTGPDLSQSDDQTMVIIKHL